jgi:hypothetical protein
MGSGGAAPLGDAGVGGTGVGGADAACVSTSVIAHRVPLDMLLLVDQSLDQNSGNWEGSVMGVNTFVNDPASDGITAGMILFPHAGAEASCDPTQYDTLDVPWGLLPGNAFAITNAFAATYQMAPSGYYAEMQGALMAATAWQDSHPMHKVVMVMVAYGDPDYCDQSFDDLGALCADALGYNGVLTYVIGVPGSPIPDLNKIAAGGGTKQAYDVSSDITLFSAAINQIRTGALGCDFTIPQPPGQTLDPDKVNFSYTPMGSGMPAQLPRAKDLLDCGTGPGWYYDNNLKPTKIILCPASCTTVQVDNGAKVDVLFGCESMFK